MKYILSDNIALRSWIKVPYSYYEKDRPYAKELTAEEFEIMSSCNGINEIPQSELIDGLIKRKLVRVAEGNESLSEWQKNNVHNNRYMPTMCLEITAKCNYNCLHCFNAADNEKILMEMKFEDVISLLDQAQKCGINAVMLTGGEPLIHRQFINIVQAIYDRGMFVFEINTNGSLLTQKMLDELKSIGCKPMFKISFDGLGYHDWMRGYAGAEETTLNAIKLCVQNGFRTMIQYNVNRSNTRTLYETISLLDSMNVDTIRMILTMPTPRWKQNANDATMDWKGYCELMLELAKWYISEDRHADLVIWQLCSISARQKSFTLTPLLQPGEEFRDSLPICRSNRGMISIGAGGEVFPCMQMSGCFKEFGISFENVHEEGLSSILNNSKYFYCISQTVKEKCEVNGKCNSCKYLQYCCTGCPALGILFSNGDFLAPDPMKCFFFENGYYERFATALAPYHNRNSMNK